MLLKEFIKTYSKEFMTDRIFLVNKGNERTEIINPNAELIDPHAEIDSWNVQVITYGEDSKLTFFIYLKD